jgi:hypothetical protein
MKSVTEKGLEKGGGVWGGGKRPFLKRAFPPPQLPQPFFTDLCREQRFRHKIFQEIFDHDMQQAAECTGNAQFTT